MMKKKAIKVHFIFLLILFSLFSYIFINSNLEYNFNSNFLKSSDNGFSIVYPENKTYPAPMSGYYPATYGFENDEDGSDPAGWNVFEGAGYVNVRDEINIHKKVVEMYDNTNANHDELHNVFPLQTYGTVEFWVMSDDVSDTFSIRLLDDTATSVWGNGIGWLQFYQDYIRYQDNTSINHNVKLVDDNTWYHIKIEFECSTGNYQGLAKDTWRFYIDGEEFGDFGFLNDIDNVTQLYFFTRGADNNYRYYVDAVGFSWNTGYNIGDNSQEGLLLSFDTTFTPDWLGYSLDHFTNKTIIGNATIPMPAEGSHRIQVFGNDSLGTMHASILRHFTINFHYINLITPENKTYTEPMSGYYPATYGFENDAVGSDPAEWIVFEGAGYVNVINEMNNHKRVVEMYDNTNANHNELHRSFPLQTYGTVEYWMMSGDVTKANQFTLLDNMAGGVYGTGIGWLDLDEDKIRYEDNTGWHDTSKTVYDDTWYHIKVEFECTTGNYHGLAQHTWRFYVDGERFGDFPFKNTIDNVAQAYFFTRGGDSNYRCYIDAVGFSWNPNYNIGDNLNEGLLLSFEYSKTLNWIGYSLDGLANKTILGNTVLPLIGNGVHKIQVFGNDSLGAKSESEIQYFSINAPPPSISIITPSNNEFYGNNAPSFSISITAFNQITTWYTLDNSGINITFTELSGTINQTEWDKEGEGPITIWFYVNDSFGRLNYAEITINKDITDPVVIINSPLFGDQFTTMPPRFNISVDELNIDAMWYTLDGGLTTYNISQYSGYIDSGAWNAAPNGAITIRFYVRDKAGNEDYEEVIIQKSTPPYIPPDNSLIIIISVAIGASIVVFGIVLVVTLLRKKRYKVYRFKETKKPEIHIKPKTGYLICPYCHNENLIKNRYCIHCGSSLLGFKPDNL